MSKMSETHALVESLWNWALRADDLNWDEAGDTFAVAADEIEQSRAVMKQMADALKSAKNDLVDIGFPPTGFNKSRAIGNIDDALDAYRKLEGEG